MALKLAFLCLILAVAAIAEDTLKTVFEWKELDFAYPSEAERTRAIEAGEFIPENAVPVGLEVYKTKLFVTVPRWRRGIPSTLNYINLNESTATNYDQSPKLIPYPNWEAHLPKQNGDAADIISPFRVRADRCNRLWVIDTGNHVIFENNSIPIRPALIVYDLETDELIRRYDFPESFVVGFSFYATLAVEDDDCDNTFAYFADIIAENGLVIYSWSRNDARRLVDDTFNHDPTATSLNANGLNWTWSDGVFGLSLSERNSDGYSSLYYQPMIGFDHYKVSTEVLQNSTISGQAYSQSVTHLGSRGPNSQAAATFFDKKTRVLFYGFVQQNAVGCWNSESDFNPENQGQINYNDQTMRFVCDIKVDAEDNLWIVTNRLPTYMYGALDFQDVNFRVLSGPVSNAIEDSVCYRSASYRVMCNGWIILACLTKIFITSITKHMS